MVEAQAVERLEHHFLPYTHSKGGEKPYAGKPPVRLYAGCALQVRLTQPLDMAAAAKLGEQPRTESCLVGAVVREVMPLPMGPRSRAPKSTFRRIAQFPMLIRALKANNGRAS
jgi:hypothetical protein